METNSFPAPVFEFLDEPEEVKEKYSLGYTLFTLHKTDVIFGLLVCIGLMSILFFLKMGMKSVPVVAFTLVIYAWMIAQNELKGFLPEELGLKYAFGGVQTSIIVILVILQFFLGVLGTLSY